MNDWAAWAILGIFCIGALFLIAFVGVTIAESIQYMKRKKLEWKREDMIRGWSEDMLRRYRRKDDETD